MFMMGDPQSSWGQSIHAGIVPVREWAARFRNLRAHSGTFRDRSPGRQNGHGEKFRVMGERRRD
jgi:hypothetical protein